MFEEIAIMLAVSIREVAYIALVVAIFNTTVNVLTLYAIRSFWYKIDEIAYFVESMDRDVRRDTNRDSNGDLKQ